MKINQKPKLFVDMDGVLAEWKPLVIPLQIPKEKIQQILDDTLYTANYFKNLHPYKNVVAAIKDIIKENRVDVYILSCYLPKDIRYPDSNPLDDKNKWLDQHFGNLIPEDHRIFVLDGEPKVENIPFDLTSNDYLLDDYTKNLNTWIQHNSDAKGIKLINPYNDTERSWKGPRITCTDSSKKIKDKLLNIIFQKEHDLQIMLYDLYKANWKLEHHFNDSKSIIAYYNDLNSGKYDDWEPSYDEWLDLNGYNGECFSSFSYFLTHEYLDIDFIQYLTSYISPSIFEEYLEVIQDKTEYEYE